MVQYKHVIRSQFDQECQLHAPGPLHQVLPQQRTHPCSSQPLPEGLHWSTLLIDEDAQRTWPPTTLQAKLRSQNKFKHLKGRLVPPVSNVFAEFKGFCRFPVSRH